VAFDFLQGGVAGALHLHLEDLDTLKAHVSGEFEVFPDRAQCVVAEAPERVGGYSDGIFARHGDGLWSFPILRAKCGCGCKSCGSGGGG
jgi:hypothetical protein